MKVLIIEDQPLLLEDMVKILNFEGYEALGALNGRMGIQAAIDNQPDLVICDVLMPEMDGFAVLQELRSHPVLAQIPFIFLTARADEVNIKRSHELGADDYIIKPVDIDEFLGRIHAILFADSRVH